jgi:hypothetical protein
MLSKTFHRTEGFENKLPKICVLYWTVLCRVNFIGDAKRADQEVNEWISVTAMRGKSIIIIIIIIITISLMQGIYTHIPETMSLRNKMLQPFCRYCLWCPYH